VRLSLLIITFSIYSGFGQVAWLQVYGDTNNDEFTSIDVQNGVLAIGGNTNSWGAGGQDGWFLSIDPLTGNINWSKTWGYSTHERIYDVAVHQNGTIIYSGEGFRDGQNNVFLAGVGISGNLLWTRLLPHGLAEDVWHIFLDNFQGDTLVVWGDINAMFFWDIGAWDGYYFKLTTSGTVVNQYLYGGVSSSEGIHDMVWQPDQTRYLLSWSFNIGVGSSDFLLAKVGGGGVPVWQRTYGTIALEVPWAVFVYSDHLLLVGWMDPGHVGNRDVLVLRVDTLGNFLWGMVYGTLNDDQIGSAQQLGDGSIVLAGWTTTDNGDEDAILVFIDSLGHLKKTVAVGDVGDERFLDVAVDGVSIYAVGWTTSWGSMGRDGLVVRTDTSGYVPCYWREVVVDSALYFPMVINQALFNVSRGWNEVSGPGLLDAIPQNVFSCEALSNEPVVILHAELESNNTVKLSWELYNSYERVETWLVKRGEAPPFLEEVDVLGGNVLNWRDNDLPEVQEVYYQVLGYTASGHIVSNVVRVDISKFAYWVWIKNNATLVKLPYNPEYPLEVFDGSGRKILSWHGQPFSTIIIDNVPTGIYWFVNGHAPKQLAIGF